MSNSHWQYVRRGWSKGEKRRVGWEERRVESLGSRREETKVGSRREETKVGSMREERMVGSMAGEKREGGGKREG